MNTIDGSISLWLALLRGIRGRCPKCGAGKLFASYLKPVAACAVCAEPLGHIRADDGPPWLTVLIIGHIVLPIIFTVGPHSSLPDWLLTLVWLALTCLLMFLILPRAKGLFIGALWKQKTPQISV